jgi:hypothetical protein
VFLFPVRPALTYSHLLGQSAFRVGWSGCVLLPVGCGVQEVTGETEACHLVWSWHGESQLTHGALAFGFSVRDSRSKGHSSVLGSLVWWLESWTPRTQSSFRASDARMLGFGEGD